MRLSGKAALSAAPAAAICRAIAMAFAEAGAAVACCDIDLAGAQETARLSNGRAGGPLAQGCDVASESDTLAAAAAVTRRLRPARHPGQRCGAARRRRHGRRNRPRRLADRVVDINLTGSFLLCRAALPLMIAGGGGSIILIASQLGRVGSAGRAAYCATKGALIQLAKVMAIDHAEQNIRVNTCRRVQSKPQRLTSPLWQL